jgi:predicted metalloprotease with PDZ domain
MIGAWLVYCLLAAVQAPLAVTYPDVTYALTPVENAGALQAIDVAVTFTLPATHVAVALPSEYAGATRLYEHLHDVHTSGAGASLQRTAVPFKIIVTGTPGRRVTVSYSLQSDPAMQIRHPEYFEPIVKPDYFFLIGAGALIVPDLGAGTYNVHVRWNIADPLPAYGDSFGVETPAADVRLKREAVPNLVFFGGDYRIRRIPGIANPVFVVLRGKWTFSDGAFAGMVARVIGIERQFWRDQPDPYYAVILMPSDERTGNIAGSAYANSIALDVPPAALLDEHIAYTIAHETFHSWNPARLMAPHPPAAAEAWFYEGFTDYYAYALMLRAGVISPDQYFATLNRNIATFTASPAATVTNAQYAARPFDPNLYEVAYRRGTLLAMRWDALIRAQTGGAKSLDDAMRGMLVHNRPLPLLSNAGLGRYFDLWTHGLAHSDIAQYVERGERLDPPADAFGACAKRIETTAHGKPQRIEYSMGGAAMPVYAYRPLEPAQAFRSCLASDYN